LHGACHKLLEALRIAPIEQINQTYVCEILCLHAKEVGHLGRRIVKSQISSEKSLASEFANGMQFLWMHYPVPRVSE